MTTQSQNTQQNTDTQMLFYDIESLSNVFSLCDYSPGKNTCDVFLLVDDALNLASDNFELDENIRNYISERIYAKNKNFNGTINYYDLHDYESNLHLVSIFGAKDDNNTFEKIAESDPRLVPFINDTDKNYSDKDHCYLMGYNSFNYDTTMLALYLSETFWLSNDNVQFNPPSAQTMREHNDNLFTQQYKSCMPSYLKRNKNSNIPNGYANRENIIRANMLKSGRHLDVAQFNEKMQKVALKRLLGMLGHQILESDKLSNTEIKIRTIDELADLIAYNISDSVNLHNLFLHKTYKNNFALKKKLLSTYPELVYNQQNDTYAPEIRPDNVRRDRLCADSSSAKLASRSLCPYGTLNDIETVSFMYPSEEKAKATGVPRVNVLDECRKFFYNLYPDRPDLQAEFDRIYFYYKNNIEGRNFNSSDEYADYWSNVNSNHTALPAYCMSEIPKYNLALTYYKNDGSPSDCYITFGIGGIHGAQYNQALYDADCKEFAACEKLFNTVKTQYPDPLMLKQKIPGSKKAWSFDYNGETYKASYFLKAGSTAKSAEWKNIEKKRPSLFRPSDKGIYKLNKRYTYTSIADCNHEDFTSYYPNLLIMMEAFLNEGLGYDRYYEIFGDKEKYGKYMKDPNRSKSEVEEFGIMRNGTKLILNSASGAADAAFFTPIRMNNRIMSMRIIGQLFTWRIGQAQTYEGAQVISTNTDGLYTVFDEQENARVLAREAANIHVDIKPEFCRLVSKDSNNRLELTAENKIITASGGTLACYKEPDPTKALAHAAILDYALCEYLRNVDSIHGPTTDYINQPFDRDKGWVILYNSRFAFADDVEYLKMFQTIIASSIGSQTYVFGETDNLQGYKQNICEIPFNKPLFNAACNSKDINIMQHYNRVFFVKDDIKTKFNKPIYRISSASVRVVTANQKRLRKRNNQRLIQHDPYAQAILEKFGIYEKDYPADKEARIVKVSGVDTDWHVYIENRSLYELSPEERKLIIENLDMDKYLTLFADGFNKNWSNCTDYSTDNSEETEGDTDAT